MNIQPTELEASRAELLQYIEVMRYTAEHGWVEDANAAVLNIVRQVEPAIRFLYPPEQLTAQPTVALLPGRTEADIARDLLWAQVDAWDEGYAAGLTPPCNANPYHADALRAGLPEAMAILTPQSKWTCVYGRCGGASFTGAPADAAAWMDQHMIDHPHDERWANSFRIDVPGRDLPDVDYRSAVTL